MNWLMLSLMILMLTLMLDLLMSGRQCMNMSGSVIMKVIFDLLLWLLLRRWL
jgi:hypothetical protein